MRSRLGLPVFIGVHLLISAAVEAVFAWRFGHLPRAIAAHLLLLAEWDLTLFGLYRAFVVFSPRPRSWPRVTCLFLMVVTCTLQVYLYALNIISNASWGRNMNGHLVSAFAPTVWSGKEPFPVGPFGISVFACGTLVLMMACFGRWGGAIDDGPGSWVVDSSAAAGSGRSLRVRVVAFSAAMASLFGVTISQGIANRDNLFWRDEPVA